MAPNPYLIARTMSDTLNHIPFSMVLSVCEDRVRLLCLGSVHPVSHDDPSGAIQTAPGFVLNDCLELWSEFVSADFNKS